jgi:hypothetical protein
MAQVEECLLCKYKALSSNPSPQGGGSRGRRRKEYNLGQVW